jgi:hypothetical protein
MRHAAALPLLALCLLGGCASPVPTVVAHAPPLPESRYTVAPLAASRGVAAWRPATRAHVLRLDGQRCAYSDLQLRCWPQATGTTPAPARGSDRR